MTKNKNHSNLLNLRGNRRQIFSLAIGLLLIYAVVPQLGKFHSSLKVVGQSQIGWLVLAFGLVIGTSFIVSGIYVVLAKRHLSYVRTLMVQFASFFASKLLPAGLGSLGLNYEYIRKQRQSAAMAGATVATNNLIGLLGHLLLLGIVLATTNASPAQFLHTRIESTALWWLGGLAILIAAGALWFRKLRRGVERTIVGALKNIRSYRAHPIKLLLALGLSMSLTTFYSLCLLACARSIGVELAFSQALIVLTVGVAGGTLAPTPGGLLGAEAGLFAGLLAYKIPNAEALAIVLIYRFLTYWLALAFGAIAWVYIRRRGYV